jgi:hypothetical protein
MFGFSFPLEEALLVNVPAQGTEPTSGVLDVEELFIRWTVLK